MPPPAPPLFSLFVTPPPPPCADRTSFRPSFVPSFSSLLCLCLEPSFYPWFIPPFHLLQRLLPQSTSPGHALGRLLSHGPQITGHFLDVHSPASLLSMFILPARRGHLKGRQIICPCAVPTAKSTVPDLHSNGLKIFWNEFE